ncbi:MAG: hypothetical protein GC159_11595 [Phycisphaera sp.]|nr:hypothetical protein [Phycisphaera sp.]
MSNAEFELACREHIDRFFAAHPDPAMQKRAHKALRLLRTIEPPPKGKPEGWAAGAIYAVFNDGKIPVGVPGVLNSEFEQLMGVTMSTIYYRAARVRELFTF